MEWGFWMCCSAFRVECIEVGESSRECFTYIDVGRVCADMKGSYGLE